MSIEEKRQMSISPMLGRKKKINLKRTRYNFLSSKEIFHLLQNGIDIHLPSLEKNNFEYRLSSREEVCYFDCISGEAFKINGVRAFSAIVEVGDRIEFYYNIIEISKKDDCYVEKYEKSIVNRIIGEKKEMGDICLIGKSGSYFHDVVDMLYKSQEDKVYFEKVHTNLYEDNNSLLDEHLFGRTDSKKKGVIEKNRDGIIYISDIETMGHQIQKKLANAISLKKIIGANGEKVEISTHFIVGCRGKLEELVRKKNLDLDLFYALGPVSCFELDDLCESKMKIKFICEKFCKANDMILSPELLAYYNTCPWVGNDEELYSHLKMKLKSVRGRKLEYGVEDAKLKYEVPKIKPWDSEIMSVDKLKSYYFNYVYMKTQRNISLTSKVLEVTPVTVRRWVSQQGWNECESL